MKKAMRKLIRIFKQLLRIRTKQSIPQARTKRRAPEAEGRVARERGLGPQERPVLPERGSGW